MALRDSRLKYWIIKGRQFLRQVIHKCIICHKLEGLPCALPPPPPLPDFRVTEQPPFMYTGVDFGGPLYIKTHYEKGLDLFIHVLRHNGGSPGDCS